ncbi:flagellar basal body rod protein FlgC [Ammoniphilus oxalaticus]|uniref:Flagellar basal-body rod protein FlgC n=1 Tax=Ammoniphilus oxalaticus TaxID=66863 RepID=A0A419SJP5_9BACL|nr:flagellar basal body rod protein FlgC [Ammoniphilus oxalaticus]RKD24195.1 flagellar basal body rod protein FlgC [Ammoniphilus oxalaticus]
MALFGQFGISGSALTAQRLRMDIISANIANATTTRGRLVDGQWTPYQRKMAVVAPRGGPSFDTFLNAATQGKQSTVTQGVRVTEIIEDQTPFKLVYDPAHPDANTEGYVQLPNVDLAKEMVDMLSATRAYEANVTAFNAGKNMEMKALEIGR